MQFSTLQAQFLHTGVVKDCEWKLIRMHQQHLDDEAAFEYLPTNLKKTIKQTKENNKKEHFPQMIA